MSLDILFTDRPEVKNFLSSKQFKQKKIYFEVPGPYTDKGHFRVLANIDKAEDLLQTEQWVVPLSPEERGDRVPANIKLLAEDYEQKYVGAWEQFMLDIEVKTPANLKEAAELYAELQKPEWPYLRVVRTLEDHTQWKKAVNDAALNQINKKLNQKVSSKTKGLRFGFDVKKIAGRASRVPDTFKKAVAFAIPQGGGAQVNVTQLSQYLEILARLRKRMVEELDKDPNASVNVLALDLKNAMLETEALFAPTDDTARRILRLLLLTPLNVGGNIPLPTGASIGGS
jgi:type VI secretion system protein ImpL